MLFITNPLNGPGVLCNIGYPPETHLKTKSREISFAHNFRFNCPIVLKFCTEHGSDTAVPCAKFQNDWPLKHALSAKIL